MPPPQVVHVRSAGKVAAALSNAKCQKILDYLASRDDATESKIAKDLAMPLSTVHYNMKILLDAKLVLDDQFTYSEKGREVTHYRMSKAPIVIIQEEDQLSLLKAIAPAALIAAGLGIAWSLLHAAAPVALKTAAPIAESGLAQDAAAEGTRLAFAAQAAPIASQPDFLPYFLAGVAVTLVLSFAALLVYRTWQKRPFS